MFFPPASTRCLPASVIHLQQRGNARQNSALLVDSEWPAGIMIGKILLLKIPFRIASASVIRTVAWIYRENIILSLPSIIAHMLVSRGMEAMTAKGLGMEPNGSNDMLLLDMRWECNLQKHPLHVYDEHFANISSWS